VKGFGMLQKGGAGKERKDKKKNPHTPWNKQKKKLEALG